MKTELDTHTFEGGCVAESWSEGCRLILPISDGQQFTLAQMDDMLKERRSHFPHQAPLKIELEAKVSGAKVPGTWGFGLWNDPFSLGLLAGGASRILPVLPNAAWFFYGSPENHLSLFDDLPGSGFMARTYRSPLLPGVFSLLTMFLFPWVISKKGRRSLRRMARHFVKEAGVNVDVDVCEWHTYTLDLKREEARFLLDGEVILKTPITPRGSLAFLVWMDNQYFRFDSTGRMEFGFLPIPSEQELMIKSLNIIELGTS
jgi:hypothetical protein